MVLLTAPLAGGADNVGSPLDLLPTHDWREPLIVAAKTFDKPRGQQSRIGLVVGRLRSLWRLTLGKGPFPAWSEAMHQEWLGLGHGFRPELVWATFGNVSTLLLARRIARSVGCPWVIDAKDNWSAFIAKPTRRLVARRLVSAAGFTANSRLHLEEISAALPDHSSCLVYSGVADPFFKVSQAELISDQGEQTLLLVGGIYRAFVLDDYLGAVATWRAGLTAEQLSRFRFRYTGTGIDEVEAGVLRHGLADCSVLTRSVPLDALASLMRSSFCASYLWEPITFHHKLLELLVASRNVMVFPGEHRESMDLAKMSATPFLVCANGEDIRTALERCWQEPTRAATPASTPGWHWRDFAGTLESFFERLLAAGKHIDSTREQASEA